MNLQSIRAALAFIQLVEQYGPAIKQIVADIADAVKKAHELLSSSSGHPSLTIAERSELYRIIEQDPTTIGMGGSQTIGDVPPPPPPSTDPTTIEYATKDEAIAQTTAVFPLVLELPNRKFVIYRSGIAPLPGTQVYP